MLNKFLFNILNYRTQSSVCHHLAWPMDPYPISPLQSPMLSTRSTKRQTLKNMATEICNFNSLKFRMNGHIQDINLELDIHVVNLCRCQSFLLESCHSLQKPHTMTSKIVVGYIYCVRMNPLCLPIKKQN